MDELGHVFGVVAGGVQCFCAELNAQSVGVEVFGAKAGVLFGDKGDEGHAVPGGYFVPDAQLEGHVAGEADGVFVGDGEAVEEDKEVFFAAFGAEVEYEGIALGVDGFADLVVEVVGPIGVVAQVPHIDKSSSVGVEDAVVFRVIAEVDVGAELVEAGEFFGASEGPDEVGHVVAKLAASADDFASWCFERTGVPMSPCPSCCSCAQQDDDDDKHGAIFLPYHLRIGRILVR